MKSAEDKKAYNQAYKAAHRKELAAYQRAYNAANREKRKAYLEANKDFIRVRREAYCDKNRAAINKQAKEHRLANAELVKQQQKKYRDAHPEKNKLYRESHREEHRARVRKRRALKNGGLIGDPKVIIAWEKRWKSKLFATCYWCKKQTPVSECHSDHIIAIALGGAHSIENQCISCANCNQSKGAKPISDWNKTLKEPVLI